MIGGDDKYRDQDEKNEHVLSSWAKSVCKTQFTKDYLDGRTSFIFSWDKKHRPIHEEALLHFLLPEKKGEKFELKARPLKPRKTVAQTSAKPLQGDVPFVLLSTYLPFFKTRECEEINDLLKL